MALKLKNLAHQISGSIIPPRIDFAVTRFLASYGVANPLRHRATSEYWASRDLSTNHSPQQYTIPDETTELVLGEFLRLNDKNLSFFEVGCNAGRNLKYLHDHGFKKLGGVDINRVAVEQVLKDSFPKLHAEAELKVGNAADVMAQMPSNAYDVVFSNAVLIHIPPRDLRLFEHMARVSSKYVAIFTEEHPPQGWPYDYERIFGALGMKLVLYKIFFGQDSRNRCLLPTELYNEDKHFFGTTMVRIFIKCDDAGGP